MKRELRKFFCRKSTIVFLYITVIAFCVLTLQNTIQVSRSNDLSFYLNDYANRDQLVKEYEEAKLSFENNRAEYEEMGLDLQPIRDRLAVFEYVIEHYMESSEGVLYSETYAGSSRDSLCVMMSMNGSIQLIMLLVTAYLSMNLFVLDFTGKRHRLLYAGRQRMQVLWEKFGTYLLLSLLSYTGLQLLGGIYTFIFSTHVNNVIFVINGHVIAMHIALVWILEFFSLMVCLLPYMLAFFFFGVMTHNEIVAGMLDIVFFFVVRVIATYAEKAPLNVLGNQPLYAVAFGQSSLAQWGIINAAFAVVIVLLALVSCAVFRRADLS